MNALSPRLSKFNDELGAYLQAHGVGTYGKSLFHAQLPQKPISCIAYVVRSGPVIVGEPLIRLETQILVRDMSYDPGLSRTQDIYELLDHKADILATIQGRVVPLARPGAFFRDVNAQYVFTSNYAWLLNPVIS